MSLSIINYKIDYHIILYVTLKNISNTYYIRVLICLVPLILVYRYTTNYQFIAPITIHGTMNFDF